mgnify:FL=1
MKYKRSLNLRDRGKLIFVSISQRETDDGHCSIVQHHIRRYILDIEVFHNNTTHALSPNKAKLEKQ